MQTAFNNVDRTPETILVVEDDPGVAHLERRALERRGYNVVSAATGAAVLAAMEGASVDLIVMDFRLADGITGLELFAQLKGLGYDVPVIMVTGFSNESTAIDALRQGVRDFIPKTAAFLDYLPEAVERVLGVLRTERKLAESEESLRLRDEQLRQSQKMEAIGQLAGGVAHDFNNLLTIILSYTDMLQEQAPKGSQESELLGEVYKAAERAGLLTRQLLTFSRRQVVKPMVVNLNDVVANLEKMLSRLIGEDIAVHTILEPMLDPVLADPGQIEQVLLNLAVNARDAMPQGGELRIVTANVEFDAADAQARGDVQPGSHVMLAVSDTGCGMDKATLARIFEPFFTTKGPGKGTGLGLATVYGIVKQSNGHIDVESKLGRGTSFNVYLPVAEAAAKRDPQCDSPKASLRGRETVLLVEDEPKVRELSSNALRTYGYTVLEAGDPLEAIRVNSSHDGAIDMLLTDVVMPHLNGRRLAELLQSERPGLRVLYVSGYTDDAIVRHGVLENEVDLLSKPFTPNALAVKVRDVLDRHLVT